nr:protein Skeletor, isoforms B/C-like isoform X2 [Dermacentor andersoni]
MGEHLEARQDKKKNHNQTSLHGLLLPLHNMLPSLTSAMPHTVARWLLLLSLLLCTNPQGVSSVYYGKTIGPVKTNAHSFTGTVYAANDTSVVITGLNYDGKGPAAYFWAGFNTDLDNNADKLLDEHGSDKVLKAYTNAEVRLTLPKKITAYKSLGIYCKQFGADFGNVKIPDSYELPNEQSLGKLSPKQHNTMAAEVILKDSSTMLLKQFEYDDTKCSGSAFFVSAPSDNPPPDQLTRLPYDNGKTTKLERYDRKDVIITLPDSQSWNDFKWFSVYCIDAKQSYADIAIDPVLSEKVPLHVSRLASHASPDNSPNAGSTLGPLSVLSVFSLGVATVVAAIATSECFGARHRVKSC